MIKRVLYIVFILIFSACSKNQIPLKEEIKQEVELKKVDIINDELIPTIKDIATLISNDNSDILNSKYINSKFGFYEFYKDEESGKTIFKHISKLEELDDYVASFEPVQEEIIFNCNSQSDSDYGWSKDGIFFYKKTDSLFFEKIKSLIVISNLEENSYEVIITNNIVFTLSKIENNWYIIAVDRVKTDCYN